MSSVAARPRLGWRARLRRDRVLVLMAVPGIAALLLFHYLPLLGNVIAFEDYQPFLGILGSEWVGLEKFSILVNGDPAFVNAVKNTLVLTLVQVIFVFPAPIMLALMINSLMSDRLRRIVQNVLYLPHFLSWVVVVAIFQQLLGGSGLLNSFLRSRGAETLEIIGNPDLFIGLLTSQVVWKDSGWATILFLAALSQVDQSLYEASAIDGASRSRQLWHVTLPALKGVIILLLILRLGDSLNVGFEQIILQQKAVGSEASEVIDTYVFNYGILGSDWGTSAAVGLVKGVIATILVVGANKVAHVFGEDGVYRA
ncbi:carbohydrate ABC transporter membrane protein 1, CUT1 family [Microlunatus sagamiharensis]|uniref:Carbohydrate ABC transporter membrane protein 1, CUT1 family n=1 Tax=Microlunatus sagamiharensis TaxID=546874 RepID=A0A1H2M666_9ACTN|nr:ABC transporter permease subunit [Microlunatus sagamiharensis]SDU88438.1 carbohydrate ABC transporter membrane protein 1, CUT1 family [Microlunatus sagamiharensis]